MGDLRNEIRAMSLREALRLVVKGYDEHDLLTFASALATVVIVLTYLYFASAAFLTGAELDAILHRRVED